MPAIHPIPPHATVLLDEAVSALLGNMPGNDISGLFVDGTFGRGGHARRILQRLGQQGRLLAFDKDPEAVQAAADIDDARFSIRHQGFSHMADLPPASVQGLLLDLGVSSPQIDAPQRGFSFRFDGPLDMRMDTTRGPGVGQWLAGAHEARIAEVIRDYGEERYAGSIAKAIVAWREKQGPVASTAELATIVAGAVKSREAGQNPATRTFQALRIFINAELEELRQALAASLRVLAPGGRLVVISFHSLEDRIVKQFIAWHAKEQPHTQRHQGRVLPLVAPAAPSQPLLLKALARIRPDAQQVQANPRARSAVMRVAQRTEAALAC